MARRLCRNVRISQSVTVLAGTVIVNLPAGSYEDDQMYCIVIAQTIPSTATVNAPVVFTIGTGTQQYQCVNCDCSPCTACQISTRTKYPIRVETTATSAIFRRLDTTCRCCSNNNLTSVNGTAPTTSTDTEDETT